MIPKFRTTDYGSWRACERFHVLPPGIKSRWEDMNAWEQSLLIGYDQIRQYEEVDEFSVLLKTIAGVPRL